ncbi:lipoprotein signal peptidase [Mycoplasma sp. CAG:956]|nr:lipoprotein signal peptidase [Mycoplasma sp. CAG:956]
MKTSIIISILITILDQIIKFIIDKKVLFIEILPKLFNIHKVYNYGVAFSFLENKRYLILLFSLILIYFLFNLRKDLPKTKKYDILFGVILGGIIGNLIDRVFRGYVIDYLETFIFGISFPIFNLADICITLGIILMVLIMSLGDKK